MERVGLLSRILLFLMASLVVAVGVGLGMNAWRRAHWRPPTLGHASHIAQAAAIIDTVLRAKPEDVPTVLQAVSGEIMRADVVAAAPQPDGLVPAPRVAAKIRSLMSVPAPGLEAYTDGAKSAYPQDDLEGVIRRAVVPLSTGRILVVGVVVFVPTYSWEILGLPTGFWVGALGFVVAALAILAALREAGPLRRLTEAVSRFDGRVPQQVRDDVDTPEIGRLIRAVGDMQQRVATLVRERSFLIGAISHDAKTYLTRLRLRSEEIGDPGRRAALIGDVEAMSELIDTSLAYARGTVVTPQRRPVDLADLVAAELAEREALGARLALRGNLGETAIVEGDPVALRRVVANLIDNAVKFGVTAVDVSVEALAGTCRILVDDDGAGIPAEERETVFSAFYRVEKSRSRETGGSGLGLAIARQIVEAHGGTIGADAAPSGGARLVVSLPACREMAPA